MKHNALLMDYYELSMAQALYFEEKHHQWGIFDYYFRRCPDHGGYAIFAGLETFIKALEELKFQKEDIEFLKQKNFHPEFLNYLKNFTFQGEIYTFKEGSVIFPNEPILTVRAPLIECYLIETLLLLTLNHQSLIASKAARICSQAQEKPILEFGARRAHGKDAALLGTRAAYIGGIQASANTQAEALYKIPATGTMSHAFIQSFASEYDAFLSYAKTYPENTILLVDTYNTLQSGIPNAIAIHENILKPQGKRLKAIRIDSGDLAYLSRSARKILDKHGLTDCKIIVSNSLDEFLIKDLMNQKAAIDGFGVGERLITAKSDPVFGGVYKIVALEDQQNIIPKIKISENPQKTTTPGFKQVWRFYDQDQIAIADLITLRDETIDSTRPYTLFDPHETWKQKTLTHYQVRPMLHKIWQKGALIAPLPSLEETRTHCQNELKTLWQEVRRLENPHGYYVDLSKKLWQLKQNMLQEIAQQQTKAKP